MRQRIRTRAQPRTVAVVTENAPLVDAFSLSVRVCAHMVWVRARVRGPD